jgi:hypothetical protein
MEAVSRSDPGEEDRQTHEVRYLRRNRAKSGSLDSHHPSAIVGMFLSFDSNPTSFSQFNQTSSGQQYGLSDDGVGKPPQNSSKVYGGG